MLDGVVEAKARLGTERALLDGPVVVGVAPASNTGDRVNVSEDLRALDILGIYEESELCEIL